MRILVIGSGLMGPAAAYNAMVDDEVERVTVCDLSDDQLGACRETLRDLPGADKVDYRRLDMNDRDESIAVMRDHAAGVAALPRDASMTAFPLALEAGMPYMDLTRLDIAGMPRDELDAMKSRFSGSRGFVILGCGLEPGLTEIMARRLAEQLDSTDELHIQCGGIPTRPAPPLGYKIVFGGKRLPLRDSMARMVKDGRLVDVPRYSDPEPVSFDGVGDCEAWHEGFFPWLLELEVLKGLRTGTQKTVRWPGYSHKVTVLRELGLLSEEPVDVDGKRDPQARGGRRALSPGENGPGGPGHHDVPRHRDRREGRPARHAYGRDGRPVRRRDGIHLHGPDHGLHRGHRRADDGPGRPAPSGQALRHPRAGDLRGRFRYDDRRARPYGRAVHDERKLRPGDPVQEERA